VPDETLLFMCVTVPTGFSFACILLSKRSETTFHALVMAIWSWLNNYQETPMNKDQVKGRVEEAKGKVKEVTGKLLDDEGMEIEGNVQKNVGKIQKGFGDLKEDIKKDK
ncbi:MAG: CsbD family protein, partial [Methylococcaceae bacterium]